MRLELRTLEAEPRQGKKAAQCIAAEVKRIEAAYPEGTRRVVLDERGARLTAGQFARCMKVWRSEGRDLAFLTGGPDGLAPAL